MTIVYAKNTRNLQKLFLYITDYMSTDTKYDALLYISSTSLASSVKKTGHVTMRGGRQCICSFSISTSVLLGVLVSTLETSIFSNTGSCTSHENTGQTLMEARLA